MLCRKGRRSYMEDKKEVALAERWEARLQAELRAVNERSARFGLMLNEQGVTNVAARRRAALAETGRVELGGSAVPAIIDGFCDSPYLQQDEYEETLSALVEAFYYYKNESGDRLTDGELICAMRERYDASGGSVEAVIGTTLDALCRAAKHGLQEEPEQEEAAKEETDGES